MPRSRRPRSEDELLALHRFYAKLAGMAKKDEKLTASHSVEEAEARHLHPRRDGERELGPLATGQPPGR